MNSCLQDIHQKRENYAEKNESEHVIVGSNLTNIIEFSHKYRLFPPYFLWHFGENKISAEPHFYTKWRIDLLLNTPLFQLRCRVGRVSGAHRPPGVFASCYSL